MEIVGGNRTWKLIPKVRFASRTYHAAATANPWGKYLLMKRPERPLPANKPGTYSINKLYDITGDKMKLL
jgi:hypothetical protein